MDRAKSKRIRNIRVIATNLFMSLSVIVIVFILMFFAMGFTFNEEGKLEQAGLAQFVSNPSGATVEIDGKSQFGHTEMSKMLSGGYHDVKISKSDYDTWTKRLRVDSGLLTRIEWIRLFPNNPEINDVATFNDLRLATFSPNRKKLITIEKNSNKITIADIQNDYKTTQIDLDEALSTTSNNALTGTLSITAWNDNNTRFIMKWVRDSKISWHLVDLEHNENSTNLSNIFNLAFDSILVENDSASKLWALENGNLRIIDANNHTISSVFATNIEKVANNRDVAAFIHKDGDDRNLSIYKEGEKGYTAITKINNASDDVTVKLAMGTYWNENWLAYTINKRLYILGGRYPSYGRDKASSLKTKLERDINYLPQLMSVNFNQRVIVVSGDNQLTSYDTETKDCYDVELAAPLSNINWLDNYLIWQKTENSIYTRDFDGDNRRMIIADANNPFPVVITENNRWLYYFDVTEEETATDATNKTPSDSVPVSPTETAIRYTLKRKKLQ